MKVGFFGLLGLLFIGLKLGGIINWSWLWVLSPFWLGFVLWILIFAVIFGIGIWIEMRKSPQRKKMDDIKRRFGI